MLCDTLRQPKDGQPLGDRRARPQRLLTVTDHRATLQSLSQTSLLHVGDTHVVFWFFSQNLQSFFNWKKWESIKKQRKNNRIPYKDG